MLVRFHEFSEHHDRTIFEAADRLNVFPRIKWSTAHEVRFDLALRKDSYMPVPSETWHAMIAALYAYDPKARIKTARAIYRSRADFETQNEA